uniref:Uncharacterized protein n=1 Tax=Setaria viridis TaxID=4556 RepID=A0A4U6T4J9_SETVI|nr:hypothetical protein SEVIR_9G439300v2 [Setaria viridis]
MEHGPVRQVAGQAENEFDKEWRVGTGACELLDGTALACCVDGDPWNWRHSASSLIIAANQDSRPSYVCPSVAEEIFVEPGRVDRAQRSATGFPSPAWSRSDLHQTTTEYHSTKWVLQKIGHPAKKKNLSHRKPSHHGSFSTELN